MAPQSPCTVPRRIVLNFKASIVALIFFVGVYICLTCIYLPRNEDFSTSIQQIKLLPSTLPKASVKKIAKTSASASARSDEAENEVIACKIPKIDPFKNATLKLIEEDLNKRTQLKEPPCFKDPPRFKTDLNSTLVSIDPESEFWKTVSCCYVPFTTIGINYVLKFINPDTCIPITGISTHISEQYENVCVNCTDISNSSILVYRDYFNFFRVNMTSKEGQAQAPEDQPKVNNKKDYLNVISLGIDSVTLTNFQRFLPKTREYLMKDLEAIEFTGLNNIGFGTLGFLVPTLTGCTLINEKAGVAFPNGVTGCPLIWEHYAKKGYMTVLSQDEHYVNAFNYLRKDRTGRTKIQFDNFPYIKGVQSSCPFAGDAFGCFEHKFAAEHLSDRIIEVAIKLRGKRYYHHIWTGVTTHEFMAGAKFLEDTIYRLLRRLKTENLLNNTVLILMSDHGVLPPKYAITAEGSIESRFNLLYFVFPEWFKKKHSTGIANMKMNAVGLSSPYDIYRTLLDILNLATVTNEALHHRQILENRTKKGLSFFLPIHSTNRTCEFAHIQPEYCVCLSWRALVNASSHYEVQESVEQSIRKINAEISNYPQCSRLHLDKIIDGKWTKNAKGHLFYDVVFQVTPSYGIFGAIVNVRRRFGMTSRFSVIGEVMRKDRYGNQSSCLGPELTKVGHVRRVCFCK